jgi:hypothetical protein
MWCRAPAGESPVCVHATSTLADKHTRLRSHVFRGCGRACASPCAHALACMLVRVALQLECVPGHACGRVRASCAHADAHARPRPLNACDHPRAAVGLRALKRAHEPGGGLTCALLESLTSTLGRQIMASEASSSHDLIAELRSKLMEARNETAEMRAQLELSGNCRPDDEKPSHPCTYWIRTNQTWREGQR